MYQVNVQYTFDTIYAIFEELGTLLLASIPQILLSASAVILGIVFIRLVRTYLEKRMETQRLGEHLSHTLVTLLQWTTTIIVLSFILLQFGLNLATITGFISVIGGTVIGFAAVNTLGNAIAGFIVMISRPFRVGDRIFFNGRFSDVISINLIYTKLRTPDLVYVNVPNQELLKSEVDNYGKRSIVRRSVSLTAGYDDDRVFIEDALLEAVKKVDLVLKAPLPYVRINDFQNYAMEYTLYYFIREIKRMPWIEGDVRKSIVDIFIAKGIDLRTPLLSKRPEETTGQVIVEPKQAAPRKVLSLGGVDVRSREGVGPVYAEKLNSVYIRTVSDLLEAGKTVEGRVDLSEKTGISRKQLLKWVNQADLMRIDGVGGEYSELLFSAGISTVVELSRRNPVNLYPRLLEENEAKKLVRRLPTQENVEKWVEEAKTLPRKITY
jgi:small-conductance mechanosensitive channel